MNEQDVRGLLKKLNTMGYSMPTFVKVYIKQKDKESLKKTFIKEYNKSIEAFKQTYEEIKEEENKDWEYVRWPSRITKRNIKDADDGLVIILETYWLDYYGTDVEPIFFDEIIKTFDLLKDYEHEGVISEDICCKYPEPHSYVIGNKGREQYDYTYNRVKEYIEKEYSDFDIL